MKNNLVTVSIPTYNSAPFLERCLAAVRSQTHKSIEINIVDGKSTDDTLKIAKEMKVEKIKIMRSSLMRARYEGVKMANGEFVLLLDSDQILRKEVVKKCLDLIRRENVDMVFLEENVFSKNTLIEKLFYLDRKLVHGVRDFDPYTSVLLPRFFKKDLLLRAYENVPVKTIDVAMPQDHAIIYLECWKLSKKIGYLKNSVTHIEPSSLSSLFKKFFRWGFYSQASFKTEYDSYFKKRTERFRKGLFRNGLVKESFGSIMLLLLKGFSYKLGFFSGKLMKHKII